MDDIYARLANCFSIVFQGLSGEDIPRAGPESVEGWDSVATITLLLTIEEEFGISVDLEAVEEFVSFERILAYLRRTQDAVTSEAAGALAHGPATNNSEEVHRGAAEAS